MVLVIWPLKLPTSLRKIGCCLIRCPENEIQSLADASAPNTSNSPVPDKKRAPEIGSPYLLSLDFHHIATCQFQQLKWRPHADMLNPSSNKKEGGVYLAMHECPAFELELSKRRVTYRTPKPLSSCGLSGNSIRIDSCPDLVPNEEGSRSIGHLNNEAARLRKRGYGTNCLNGNVVVVQWLFTICSIRLTRYWIPAGMNARALRRTGLIPNVYF